MATAQLYPFSVQQVLVAAWLGGGTYGTPFTLQSTKEMGFTQDAINDEAQGNSKITDEETQLISATLTLDTAGFDTSLLTVFTGISTSTSGADTVFPVNNALLPYFGMIAQVLPATGDVLFFYPYCKVTKGWNYKNTFGKIMVPQFSCKAIQDPTFGYIYQEYRRPTATLTTPITFPPTT